jgi:hypothetical protein
MTRDDIIRLAREAGFVRVVATHADGSLTTTVAPIEELERFAALVASAERQQHPEQKPMAWSVLNKRTGRCWFTHESVYTAQHQANHYSHRESDGSPSMVVIPLYAHPPVEPLCEPLRKLGGI